MQRVIEKGIKSLNKKYWTVKRKRIIEIRETNLVILTQTDLFKYEIFNANKKKLQGTGQFLYLTVT